MIYGLEPVIFIGRVLLVIAAITTTAFPILYSRVTWYKSLLGMAMMLLATTLSATVLLKLVLTFFSHSPARNTLLWINVATLLLIIVATSTLTYLQWSFRRKIKRGESLMDATPKLSDKVYDILKPIVTVYLPGLSTLYFVVAQIWGLPAPEEVVGTIAAVNVFLGGILHVSTKAYNSATDSDGPVYAGSLDYSKTPDGKGLVTFNIDPNSDADTWANQEEVTFKVNK